MKTNLLLCAFLFLLLAPLSAQERGVTPSNHPTIQPSNHPNTTTYAVVIGISDYQDEAIPDLQFAHRDAEAFAGFLRSPAGGSLDHQHLHLLTNSQATAGQIVAAFEWLMDVARENDRVIIYFSGHGDVEEKTAFQLGFLLPWDSPARSYMAGAYPVYFLQAVISTLSTQNQARVVVITDACHAGKLAGSAIGGPQITGLNLAKQFANETKILSCQANEYSVEGEQWGDGRGVFSYHLVDGLYGLADNNNDALISLSEIDRYLEDHVTREAEPQVQIPVVLGDKRELIAAVDPEVLDQLKKFKAGQLPVFAPVEQRGIEEDLLAGADSTIQEYYRQFQLAIREKRFLTPAGNCAELYYQQLAGTPALTPLHPYLKRNYAAALQDASQQSANAILRADPDQILRSRLEIYTSFADFPQLINRAASLLGEQHYMYHTLKAREHLFEGILLYFKYKAAKNPTTEQGNAILACYTRALEHEPAFPLAHFFRSVCYGRILSDPEKARESATRAVESAGTWTLPYVHLAYYLAKNFKQFDTAKLYLDQAMAFDSTDANVWKGWTSWYAYQKRIPEALHAAQTAAQYAPNDPFIWLNIGNLLQNQYKFDSAEVALLKSISLDTTFQTAYYYLGINYYRWGKFENAERYFLRAVELDPEHEAARSMLAGFYTGLKEYEKAEAQYLELIKYTDPGANTWFDLATVSTLNGHHREGLEYLEKALEKGFSNREKIENDEALAPLRSLPRYTELMQTYFKE
ncbi:MAG: tetratricopeptide repeat protein [Bacteroidetes bacterium]|nr:MAG: tetratricopeptide repeat protein [Bacteroidota bacterium]